MYSVLARVDVGQSVEDSLDRVIGVLPSILGALAILVIGWLVSKFLADVVYKMLQKARFDEMVYSAVGGGMIQRIVDRPAHLLSRVVYWLLMFGVITMAVSALHWPVLDNVVTGIYNYIPKVIAALLIFLVASAISAAVVKFAQRVMGDTPTSKMVAAIIPGVVMSIAFFMILNQLNIATDIVNILFTALVGALALGSALAFGLGGRDVAARMLESAYESGKTKTAQAKADMKVAKSRAQTEVERVKTRARR